MSDDDYEGLSSEEIEALKDGEEDNDTDTNTDADEKDENIKDAVDVKNTVDDNIDDDDNSVGENDNDANLDDKGSDLDTGDKTDEDGDNDTPKNKDAENSAEGSDDTKKDSKVNDGYLPFTPKFTGIDKESLDGLKTNCDIAKQKFDDGEIDYAEYSDIKDKYLYASLKNEFAEESSANTRNERWAWEQEKFYEDNNMFRENKTLNAAFVATVNNVIGTDDGLTMSDRTVLATAKKMVEADLGIIAFPKQAGVKKDTKEEKAIKNIKDSNSDRGNIPVDIGGLPTAKENTDTSEFAHLDRLEGEAYQNAINKLTSEQLREYEDS